MHRRARHLNARHAGAGLVLDSRRISGLSDGDLVSSWVDSSGNSRNATNTLTARPTYKTAIQGGQPTVRFDGVNNLLVFSPSVTYTADSSAILVYKRNTTTSLMVPLCGTTSNSTYPVYEYNDNVVYTSGDSKNAYFGPVGVAWRVASAKIIPGPLFYLFLNGVFPNILGPNPNTNNAPMTYIGARAAERSAGDISQVVFIGSNVRLTLLRRLTHSAAFSFKIKCS